LHFEFEDILQVKEGPFRILSCESNIVNYASSPKSFESIQWNDVFRIKLDYALTNFPLKRKSGKDFNLFIHHKVYKESLIKDFKKSYYRCSKSCFIENAHEHNLNLVRSAQYGRYFKKKELFLKDHSVEVSYDDKFLSEARYRTWIWEACDGVNAKSLISDIEEHNADFLNQIKWVPSPVLFSKLASPDFKPAASLRKSHILAMAYATEFDANVYDYFSNISDVDFLKLKKECETKFAKRRLDFRKYKDIKLLVRHKDRELKPPVVFTNIITNPFP